MEQVLFAIDFKIGKDHINFLYNIYNYQAVVILTVSCLRITKDKFLMEKDRIYFQQQKSEYSIASKSKFNSHFLFSILNSIHAVSFISSAKTSDSILHLSRLLHYILYDCEKEKITVRKELSSVEALASLYQLRYNHPLNIAVEVQDKDIMDRIEIPSSLFLNLFQSALQRSRIGDNPNSFIRLNCKAEDDHLLYEIVNFNGENSTTYAQTKSGVQSDDAVIHILEKYFPEKFDFFEENEGEHLYKTSVKINFQSFRKLDRHRNE